MGSSSAAPASTKARLRITRRGRLVLTSLVVGPLVAVGVIAGVSATSAIATSSSSAVVEFDYLTINSGESLWQVAERIAPASDPRDVIADIVSLNQMSTSSVEPGQRIAIPTAYSAG
ncbi:LysM peptidoglycan-binding domain-containing protein [Labedella gwakjiensis]|nr:LysM peptidoglycan-binding domain-containing protein [Labedella gwakjiensis]